MSGHLKAVIFDWAGTVVDFGCHAPVAALTEAFAQFGVALTEAEARAPMGLPKWQHVRAIFRMPQVAERWRSAHGQTPTDTDIRALYDAFLPINARTIRDHGALIPGVAELTRSLRGRGLKIGTTTGYTRQLMAELLPLAAAQGFAPDNLVCAGDLSASRPTPLMIYKCLSDLDVYPAASVVKIDDTVPGLEEGGAAGTWTVGVLLSGNECGLTRANLAALGADKTDVLRSNARTVLGQARPDYLIDSAADLSPVLDEIEARLARGERPGG
jgi:phosphonoacetaldehyde hydrolase